VAPPTLRGCVAPLAARPGGQRSTWTRPALIPALPGP